MEIIVAKHAGFCYGVKNAIKKAEEIKREYDENIFTYGPLIHNAQEIGRLEEEGIFSKEDVPDKGPLIIRSHGVGQDFYETYKEREDLFDATCHDVKKAQKIANEAHNEGKQVIIFGDGNHPEVQGILNWGGEDSRSLLTPEEARGIPLLKPVVFISQTTQSEEKFQEIAEILKGRSEDIEVVDTICKATKNRQKETKELAADVDVMIIIGGKNSSNSNKLYTMAKEVNPNTYFIETAKELRREWYIGKTKVGISAGASTPDWIIEEVVVNMLEEEKNLESAETEETMESLFVDTEKEIHAGEIVTGIVVQVSKDNLIVDIGLKAEGILPLEEFGDEAIPAIGEEVTAVLLQKSNSEGIPVLSKRKLEDRMRREKQREALKTLPSIFENKEELKGVVARTTKGGLIVVSGDIEGFLPASQIIDGYVKNLDKYVGREVRVRIIDLDLKKRLPKIVFSQKVILNEEKAAQEEDFWSRVEEGVVLNGEIKRMTDFGAFVNLGYLDGLLHISELSWDKRAKMNDLIAIGDVINVKVIGIDKDNNKVSLSLKALEEDPWEVFKKEYKSGHIVKGKVNSIVDYGAFVEIAKGVEGLLHISEISHDRIEKVADVLSVGDEIEVEILEIDENNGKVSLSKKSLDVPPQKETSVVENEMVYTSDDSAVTIGDMLKAAEEDEKIVEAAEVEEEEAELREEIAEVAEEASEEEDKKEEPAAEEEAKEQE